MITTATQLHRDAPQKPPPDQGRGRSVMPCSSSARLGASLQISAATWRSFAIDVLVCPRCEGPLTVLAYLTEAAVLEKILTHLGLPTRPPPIAPARFPQQQHLC